MSDTRGTAPPERAARSARLAAMLRGALTDPAALRRDHLEPLRQALQCDADDPPACEQALDTLAAVLYARPDLLDDELIDQLAGAARIDPLPEGLGRRVEILFRFLAASPAVPAAWARLDALLRDEGLSAGARGRLVRLVEDFVQWREDLVGLEGILALAESTLLANHRTLPRSPSSSRFTRAAPAGTG